MKTPTCPKHGPLPPSKGKKPRTLCPHRDCVNERYRQKWPEKVEKMKKLGFRRVKDGWDRTF